MTAPEPAQSRVVHVSDRLPRAIYIGRHGRGRKASPLANPFRIGAAMPRGQAVDVYGQWLTFRILDAGDPAVIDALIAARGRPLACWCRHDGDPWTPETRCHGDLIVATLARYTDDELRSCRRP